jgi:hypothetical protein
MRSSAARTLRTPCPDIRELGVDGRAEEALRWGNKWGNMPHRFQPISADLDLAKTA